MSLLARVCRAHVALVGVIVWATVGCEQATDRLAAQGVELSCAALRTALQNGSDDIIDDILLASRGSAINGEPVPSELVGSAILHGRNDVACQLIARGVPVEMSDPSLLAIACARGALDVATVLLQHGASPDRHSLTGEPLLTWALRTERFATAHLLLQHGAKANLGAEPVRLAIQHERPRLLAQMLAANPDVITRGDSASPIIWAYEQGNAAILDQVLAAGANVDAQDAMGQPLIHRAISDGALSLADRLLARGADVDARYQGLRPLDHALVSRHRDRISWLLRRGACTRSLFPDGTPPLAAALAGQDYTLAQQLLLYGTPIRDELAEVTRAGDRRAIHLLLDHRPLDLGPAPPRVDTALRIALDEGRCGIAHLLIAKGASLEVQPSYAQSAFHLALVRGDVPLVSRFIEAGADVNEPFTRPVPPQLLAQLPFEGFRWFLKNDTRVTPLMLAAASGNVELAELLIANGASKSRRTGKTKLWVINFASRRGDVPMMRLLLGADPRDTSREIVVDLSEQKARLYVDGEVTFTTRVSTGRKGYRTKQGSFAITNKYRDWTSTIYDSKMPHFQRLSCDDFGFHAGRVPSYPASHGCIRVPAGNAKKLFRLTRLGDRVTIQP